MMNKKTTDTQQIPEVTKSTRHEEKDDSGETMLAEASTDQNVLLQALTMLHTELKDFK